MKKTLCERRSHERIGWALTATFLLGMSTAWWTVGQGEVAVMGVLFGAFAAAVYAGLVKLEAPKKKSLPVDARPKQPGEKEAEGS